MSVALVQPVPYFDTRLRVPDLRSVVRTFAFGAGGIATALALVGGASWSSAWMVTLALSGHPNGPFAQSKPSLRSLALAESTPMLLGPVEMPKVVVTPESDPVMAAEIPARPWPAPVANALPTWPHAPVRTFAALPVEAPAAGPQPTIAEMPVPLPLARPVIARAPAPQQVAALAPPAPARESARAERPVTIPSVVKLPALPPAGSRIALYDIAGHTVYLPDGRRLEAHSGVGARMDDPSSLRIKMRGVTPPNIYRLTLREALFHGVRAIRLNPTDEGKMYGRAGMLAHTYMLGPTGQSNGCVSFRNYNVFLQAFLNGEVDRMVVVQRLSDAPARIAQAMRERVASAE
jgi:hypothetical protein